MKRLLQAVLLITVVFSLSACAEDNSEELETLSNKITDLESKVTSLEAELSLLQNTSLGAQAFLNDLLGEEYNVYVDDTEDGYALYIYENEVYHSTDETVLKQYVEDQYEYFDGVLEEHGITPISYGYHLDVEEDLFDTEISYVMEKYREYFGEEETFYDYSSKNEEVSSQIGDIIQSHKSVMYSNVSYDEEGMYSVYIYLNPRTGEDSTPYDEYVVSLCNSYMELGLSSYQDFIRFEFQDFYSYEWNGTEYVQVVEN